MKIQPEIEFFLRMGYFPGQPGKISPDYGRIDRAIYSDWPRRKLLEEAAILWRETIAGQFEPGRRHVVPLSGGLDSRAILAALLECTPARNIETYTFGTPGTYDYDLGCLVARETGTKHHAIPLGEIEWKDEDFLEAAFRFNHQTLLFHHAPVWLLDRFADGVIWSGYMGDVITGGQRPDVPSAMLADAKMSYLLNRRAVRSMEMTESPPEDFLPFIGGGSVSSDCVSYDEQVLVTEAIRFSAPHVLMNGFEYRIPFINTAFWDFFFSVPDKYRRDQRLYKSMLQQEWPYLFSLPTKSHFGLPLSATLPRVAARRARNRIWNKARENLRIFDWPPLPMTNYMDLDLLIRKDARFRNLIETQIEDLKRRDIVPWIDIDGIRSRHMRRQGNHGDALKMLFSLEINLKGLENQAALGKVVGL